MGVGNDLINKAQLEAKAKKLFVIAWAIYFFFWTISELLCTLTSSLCVVEFVIIQWFFFLSMGQMLIFFIIPRCWFRRAYFDILRHEYFFKFASLPFFSILCAYLMRLLIAKYGQNSSYFY